MCFVKPSLRTLTHSTSFSSSSSPFHSPLLSVHLYSFQGDPLCFAVSLPFSLILSLFFSLLPTSSLSHPLPLLLSLPLSLHFYFYLFSSISPHAPLNILYFHMVTSCLIVRLLSLICFIFSYISALSTSSQYFFFPYLYCISETYSNSNDCLRAEQEATRIYYS